MKKLLQSVCLLLVCALSAQAEVRDTIVVAQDGTGQYCTIGAALESCRAFMEYEVLIQVKPGIYREKLIVPSWLENIIILYI